MVPLDTCLARDRTIPGGADIDSKNPIELILLRIEQRSAVSCQQSAASRHTISHDQTSQLTHNAPDEVK